MSNKRVIINHLYPFTYFQDLIVFIMYMYWTNDRSNIRQWSESLCLPTYLVFIVIEFSNETINTFRSQQIIFFGTISFSQDGQ